MNAAVSTAEGRVVARARCRACAHYYITWDQRFPHGCNAMKFKSERMPFLVVRESVPGTDCLMFEDKPRHR